jgi:polysaccharide biosynthesis transport protein
MVWRLSEPRRFAAQTEIIVSGPTGAGAGTSGSDATANMPLLQDLQGLTRVRSTRTQVRVLQSPDLRSEAVAALPKAMQPFGKDAEVEITASRDTDVISISVTARDAQAAALFANGIVSTYIARSARQYREASSTGLAYLEGERARVREERRAAYDRLARYERRTGMFAPNDIMTQRVRALTDLESQIADQQVDLAQAQREEASVRAALKDAAPRIVAQINEVRNPALVQSEDLIRQLEARRTELLQSFVPTAPEIRAVDEQIGAARQRMGHELQTIIASRQIETNPQRLALQQQYVTTRVRMAGLDMRLAALRRCRETARDELDGMTGDSRDAAELLATVTQLQATYQLLDQTYQTLRISQRTRLPGVQVVTAAAASPTPVSPDLPRALAQFFALGLGAALLLALLLERVDDRIHTLEEAEETSGLPALGHIPRMPDELLVHEENASPAMLESYRILRGNLLFSSLDRRMSIIAVSSASSGEGKSTTALNLAIVMAMGGKRVVLVDGDFHRHSLHARLHLPMGLGMSSVVAGKATLGEAVQPTAVPGLFLLTTGPLPPNPSDLLSSQSMRRTITELAADYDSVILDAPPILGLSDVPIICTFADGLLLVVAARETHRHLLRAALRSLQLVKAPLLGCVLNKASERSMRYGGYYYDGYGGESSATASPSEET